MPNVILKCKNGLFHSLKNAGYLVFLLWFLELRGRVWTEKGNSYTRGRHCKTPKIMLHWENSQLSHDPVIIPKGRAQHFCNCAFVSNRQAHYCEKRPSVTVPGMGFPPGIKLDCVACVDLA